MASTKGNTVAQHIEVNSAREEVLRGLVACILDLERRYPYFVFINMRLSSLSVLHKSLILPQNDSRAAISHHVEDP